MAQPCALSAGSLLKSWAKIPQDIPIQEKIHSNAKRQGSPGSRTRSQLSSGETRVEGKPAFYIPNFEKKRFPAPCGANRGMEGAVYLGMNIEFISTKFQYLGARIRFRPFPTDRWFSTLSRVRIDIASDRRGEYFDFQLADDADLLVLDVQPQDRHLLLMSREPAARGRLPDIKDKFLCGHDERHWFVAGVPESVPVSSVVTAKEALKPRLIRELEAGRPGQLRHRHGRKTEVYLRQGEWFFIPAPGTLAPTRLVLRNEPLRRGRGKPHNCEFLYRRGGTTVYVCRQFPSGLTEAERTACFATNPAARHWGWRAMQRDPQVFVRGRVSHADHATITLDGWHHVLMNTEAESRAQTSVAFLD